MGGLSVTGEMAELDGDAAWRDDGQAANGALPRLLPPAPVRELHVHEARYGEPRLRGTALIDEVTRAGLTGRGGAAFPAGSKLSSVRERAGLRGAVLVANGMESEPASAKDPDAADPGSAPGARRTCNWSPRPPARRRRTRAYVLEPQRTCAPRSRQHSWSATASTASTSRSSRAPERVHLGRGKCCRFHRLFSGGPAIPRDKSPVVVTSTGCAAGRRWFNNVETLAHLALAPPGAEPAGFAQAAPPRRPGTFLVHRRSGAVQRTLACTSSSTASPLGSARRTRADPTTSLSKPS